jgi:four helix bundle protein
MAFASTREVEYQISIAGRLGYFEPDLYSDLQQKVEETAKVMAGLLRSLRAGKE